jgi:MSHA pilin protein MshA
LKTLPVEKYQGVTVMKNSGFTLIELIVVIVILGVLASVAAPKFINLSGDAKSALIKNISGNLKTAIKFALLKDKVAGGNGKPLNYNGNTVTFISGAPTPDAAQMRFLLAMDLPSTTYTANWSTLPCSGSEYCIVGNIPFSDSRLPALANFSRGSGVFFWPEGYVLSDCFAYYLNLADGSDPIINYVISGC